MGAGDIVVIGGGLAGSEAAWQAAEHGASVVLYEMRPQVLIHSNSGWVIVPSPCGKECFFTLCFNHLQTNLLIRWWPD